MRHRGTDKACTKAGPAPIPALRSVPETGRSVVDLNSTRSATETKAMGANSVIVGNSVTHCNVDFLQQPAARFYASDIRDNLGHKLKNSGPPGHMRHYGHFGVPQS